MRRVNLVASESRPTGQSHSVQCARGGFSLQDERLGASTGPCLVLQIGITSEGTSRVIGRPADTHYIVQQVFP